MNVDFLHSQIIRDTISPKFIESFNENLLPRLALKYGESLWQIQFYDHHLTDGFKIGTTFYYPLTLFVGDEVKIEWISWQVANYRHYENMNPFTYKGQDFLNFEICDEPPAELAEKISDIPQFFKGASAPIILSAKTDEKTFLAGKYSQRFIDLLALSVTEAVEREMCISGLDGSGVLLEMRFEPGTFMEHVSENTTYRRLLIKARACAARDLWVKWTRLDGNGTYTISDNVDAADIDFDLAEDVPGKIKEREYRYLASSESIEKYQESMGRKNITEWREMMRRVIRRGEVEKNEKIIITKPIAAVEQPSAEPLVAVTIPPVSSDAGNDEISRQLNRILGKEPQNTEADANAAQSDTQNEPINSDLNDLLRGVIGAEEPGNSRDNEAQEPIDAEETDASSDEGGLPCEDSGNSASESEAAETAPTVNPTEAQRAPSETEREIEERIRRDVEARVAAELEELRKKEREAEELKLRLEEQRRAELRERELLAEAARLAVLDKEKREADRRAEEERDRAEAERKRAEEEEAARKKREAEEREAEQKRIEAELQRKREEEQQAAVESSVVKYISKNVTLIWRRGGADAAMMGRVKKIIIATIKYLNKEDVYMRIKASVVDYTTITLNFSELPENEAGLVESIIQVLGKSNLGITKAILE